MKVLFLKDVQGTAQSGDVKEVSTGFARNFLFPRKLATHVTPGALKNAERIKGQTERKATQAKEESDALAQQLSTAYLTIAAPAGEDGRLFGTVTNQDVADALQHQYGISLDKRKISFTDPIKATGSWIAEVDLGHGTTAVVNLNVEAR
jgi:large subunit ribosomal protein L9